MVHFDTADVARSRTGGENDAGRAEHASRSIQPLHLDAIVAEQYSSAADQRDLIARYLCMEITVLRSNHGIDALQQCRQGCIAAQFNREGRGVSPHASVSQRLLAQCFAGNGAGKQARASNLRLSFDDSRAKTRLGGLNCGLLTRRSRPETDQIKIGLLRKIGRLRHGLSDAGETEYMIALREHGFTVIEEHAQLFEYRILEHDLFVQ
jgi:hypothetical protein